MKKIEYYLMHHANYYDFENQYVSYWGMLGLKESMDRLLIELKEKFPQKGLRIIHSALPRVKHTALLIQDILAPQGIRVFMRSDPRLNSDLLQINDDCVKEMINFCEEENTICLILSHSPDIQNFCNKKLGSSEWIQLTMEFQNKVILEEKPVEDLPF